MKLQTYQVQYTPCLTRPLQQIKSYILRPLNGTTLDKVVLFCAAGVPKTARIHFAGCCTQSHYIQTLSAPIRHYYFSWTDDYLFKAAFVAISIAMIAQGLPSWGTSVGL